MRNLALLALSLLPASAIAQQMLFVANQGDRTLSVIDTATGESVATIQENAAPVRVHEVAATPDGKTVFAPLYGSTGVGHPGVDGGKILVIDVPSKAIVHTIDFGHAVRPHLPVYDRKRNLIYVTSELDKTVSAIDPKSYKVLYAIPTGAEESHMLAVSPDGRFGYTANVGPGSVSVLDLNAKKTVTVIPVAEHVQRIAVSADGKLVFTSDDTSPRLAVIDATANKVKTFIDLPTKGYGGAVTPDGKYFLLSLPAKNAVAVIDVAKLSIVRTVDVAKNPQEIILSPDGKTAYVSCNVAGQVSVLDLTDWTHKKDLIAGKGADGITLATLK